MTKELEDKLYADFPDMFADRLLPESQTCMCQGCTCGDGWYHIIRFLCKDLEVMKKMYDFVFRFAQVKEKFGTLRLYYRIEFGPTWIEKASSEEQFVREKIHDRVSMVEHISGIVCEECGITGAVRRGGSWIRTLCDTCEQKRRTKHEEN